MVKRRYYNSGFTIVELTVVIVVIAILATIGIVSYNGSQVKARNAQMASAVSAYKEALITYKGIYGKYPEGSSNGSTCLGGNYPSDECWFGAAMENSAFMDALASVSSGSSNNLPMPSLNPKNLKGAMFVTANRPSPNMLDGVARDFIVYAIEGAEPCPVGPVASDNNNPADLVFYSAPPASGQTFAEAANNPAQCWLPLPK